jgi:hypothetical protein
VRGGLAKAIEPRTPQESIWVDDPYRSRVNRIKKSASGAEDAHGNHSETSFIGTRQQQIAEACACWLWEQEKLLLDFREKLWCHIWHVPELVTHAEARAERPSSPF